MVNKFAIAGLIITTISPAPPLLISKVVEKPEYTRWVLNSDLVQQPSPKIGSTIKKFTVSSGYGPRESPCPGCSSFHYGIDIAAPIGSPVFAVGYPGEPVTVVCFPNDGMGKPWSRQTAKSMPDIAIEALHLSQCNPGVYTAGTVHSFSGTAGTGPHQHIQIRWMSKEGVEPDRGKFPPPKWAVEAVVGGVMDKSLFIAKEK